MEAYIKNLRKLIEERKDCLYERQLDVLNLLYGLEDGILRSPEEIAELYHITPERVRQIERRAIRHMEHNIKTKPVRDFYQSD